VFLASSAPATLGETLNAAAAAAHEAAEYIRSLYLILFSFAQENQKSAGAPAGQMFLSAHYLALAELLPRRRFLHEVHL
jgi:hypothetical protein